MRKNPFGERIYLSILLTGVNKASKKDCGNQLSNLEQIFPLFVIRMIKTPKMRKTGLSKVIDKFLLIYYCWDVALGHIRNKRLSVCSRCCRAEQFHVYKSNVSVTENLTTNLRNYKGGLDQV